MKDVELELSYFYQTAYAMIETERACYLKRQKVVAYVPELPEVEEATAEELAKMWCWTRWWYYWHLRRAKKRYRKALKRQKRPLEEQLTKGYNAGMETALKELDKAYKAHLSRFNDGK